MSSDPTSSDGYDSADPTQLTLQRELLDYFNSVVYGLPVDAILRQWLAVYQDHFDDLAAEIAKVKRSRSIDLAQGIELDLHGARYGRLGRRRGRADGEYRHWIKAIATTYQGIGTLRDIKIAVAAGVVADDPETAVSSEEHPADLEYSLTIHEWSNHRLGLVYDLADLADPVLVDLRSPVTYQHPLCEVVIDLEDTAAGGTGEHPPAAVEIGTPDSYGETVRAGFGADRFDGEDIWGDSGSFGSASASYDEGENDGGEYEK
jgi:hypothetical protein